MAPVTKIFCHGLKSVIPSRGFLITTLIFSCKFNFLRLSFVILAISELASRITISPWGANLWANVAIYPLFAPNINKLSFFFKAKPWSIILII